MSGQASSARPWSIVLASREVWPFVEGGGLGRYVWASGRLLADHAEVTILTSSAWRERHAELSRAGDERLPEGVRFAFVDEPEGDLSPYVSWTHAWSARLLDGVARVHPDGGPDILELADYQAEGFSAVHARRGLDPRLRNTTVAVRLHTSAEMCAVLNDVPDDEHLRLIAGLERFPLRFADVLLAPGGNSLAWYSDFYDGSLAPALQSPLPSTTDVAPSHGADLPGDRGPLRLLYLNRLERRKGVIELIEAVRSLPGDDLAVTLVGGDTDSAPGGGSMRAHAERLAAGDPRIAFADRVPHERVPDLIAEHHAVVVPTRWETFSYVVRESLACNRPVIATPSGEIVDVVRPGESGWLSASASAEDLAATLREVVAAREELHAMIERRLPRSAFERDAPDERTLEAYLEVVERPRSAAASPRGAAEAPAIDAFVMCEASGGDPLPTLGALEAQRDVELSAVLAVGPSGSFPGPGPALARASVVRADPLVGDAGGAAELVLVVPAGAVLDPDFTRRAAAALDEAPDLAWVTAFAQDGTKPADAPLGSYELGAAGVDTLASVILARRSALGDGLGDKPGLVLQEGLVENLPRRASLSAASSASG
jgi:glycogen synthase